MPSSSPRYQQPLRGGDDDDDDDNDNNNDRDDEDDDEMVVTMVQKKEEEDVSLLPLSMQLLRPFYLLSYCPSCHNLHTASTTTMTTTNHIINNHYEEEDDDACNNNYGMMDDSSVTTNGNNNTNNTIQSNNHRRSSTDLFTDNQIKRRRRRKRGEEDSNPSTKNPTTTTSTTDIAVAQTRVFVEKKKKKSSSSVFLFDNTHQNETTTKPKRKATSFAASTTTTPTGHYVTTTIEQILQEYTTYTHTYGCSSRLNAGVLTTLRFRLPTLRVSGNFYDADMLALCELLLHHCNGALSYIVRLDFTLAGIQQYYGRENDYFGTNTTVDTTSNHYYGQMGTTRGVGGGDGGGGGRRGVRSHGAYALSKVLTISQHIEEVYLNGNRIGSYGSSAIFTAASQNTKLRTLLLRGCRIGERGALSFAHQICSTSSRSGLREVDLSACRIGFRGCYVIEEMLKERRKERESPSIGNNEKEMGGMVVDLEGNMVFQEVMNCVTHGLGILLGTYGTYILNRRIAGMPAHYTISCAIYSASIIVLYTSSTLYHSFFALRQTKFIFCVLDRCAIYLLIAGSYTPFLMISLHHKRIWSLHLLLFIWACAISGILVEACCYSWKHKSIFSLAMYLGMGWSCMVCLPDLVEVLPHNALVLLVSGGLAYTGGVPFFVRNNNLDHSIWHLFVLAGSIFHWLCVFCYVANPRAALEV